MYVVGVFPFDNELLCKVVLRYALKSHRSTQLSCRILGPRTAVQHLFQPVTMRTICIAPELTISI
jgi:hypothetical protein